MITSVQANELSAYIVTSTNGEIKYSNGTVVKMLGEGNTCLKDGVRVLAKSKNITKKHCQKSKILGLRVIKANQINAELYKSLTGLK